MVAALAHQVKRPVVVLTQDNEAAQNYRQTTATFLEWLKPGAGSSVQILPALDCSPYEGRSPHAEIQEQRAVALWSLARGGVRVIFAPVAAALGRFREGAFYSSLALELKVGDELNLDDLVEHLRSVGYEPGEPVAAVGQYSVRGGIVDVFPPEAEWPFRLEFFGDQLESVREFDPSSQRSRKPVPQRAAAAAFGSAAFPEILRKAGASAHLAGPRARSSARNTAARARTRLGRGTFQYFPGVGVFRSARRAAPAHAVFPAGAPGAGLGRTPRSPRPNPAHASRAWRQASRKFATSFRPAREPREVYLTEAELLQALEGVPQISLKELGMENLAPAAETSSQAVVIGGDLYFPPEGAKNSDEWRVTSDEQASRSVRAQSMASSPIQSRSQS